MQQGWVPLKSVANENPTYMSYVVTGCSSSDTITFYNTSATCTGQSVTLPMNTCSAAAASYVVGNIIFEVAGAVEVSCSDFPTSYMLTEFAYPASSPTPLCYASNTTAVYNSVVGACLGSDAKGAYYEQLSADGTSISTWFYNFGNCSGDAVLASTTNYTVGGSCTELPDTYVQSGKTYQGAYTVVLNELVQLTTGSSGTALGTPVPAPTSGPQFTTKSPGSGGRIAASVSSAAAMFALAAIAAAALGA